MKQIGENIQWNRYKTSLFTNFQFKISKNFVSAPPLSFRMGFMLKHLLLSQDDPALSRNLLSHILKSCDMEPQKNSQNDKQIEDGLIQLLYCDRVGAKELVKSTKKPIKISLGQSLGMYILLFYPKYFCRLIKGQQ